jgi:hypothetical protein
VFDPLPYPLASQSFGTELAGLVRTTDRTSERTIAIIRVIEYKSAAFPPNWMFARKKEKRNVGKWQGPGRCGLGYHALIGRPSTEVEQQRRDRAGQKIPGSF